MPQALDIVLDQELPWFAARLRKQEIFYRPDVVDLPPEAGLEREHFEAQGIRSIMVAPMALGDRLVGFLGFDAVRERRTWTKNDQTLLCIIGETFTNALERKRTEEVLRKSEEQYRLLAEKRQELEFIVNHSPAVAFLWKNDAGWPVEFVSENVDQFGYTPDDFYSGGTPFADIVHPEDLARVAEEVKEHSGRGVGSFAQEYRIVAKSGDARWIDDRTWARRDKQGNVTHYHGIALDVTERKRAEEALRESEQRYRSLFDANPEGIVILDPETREALYANPMFCKMLGYETTEIPKFHMEDFHPKEFGDVVISDFHRHVRDHAASTEQVPCLRKDGGVIYADISSADITIAGKGYKAGFFKGLS